MLWNQVSTACVDFNPCRIQAAYTKVESTDHLSIFEEIELDMTYTVVERHMTLAQSKLNTSRGQSCTSEWYLVCGYTVLLEFNSG